MAGESWKSHKNSMLERDMDTDHDAQLSEWAQPRIASTQEIVQEIRDGYARDVDPAVARARQEAMADLARSTAQIDLDQPVEADSVQRLQARIDDLLRDRQADTILSDWTSTDADEYEEDLRIAQAPAVTYVPPTPEQQYQPAADYPTAVLANTRVVPAETVDPWAPQQTADTARFQTELAIAQQVAANQVRAQQQADAEAAERIAAAALGQYIAPPSSVPARNVHR